MITITSIGREPTDWRAWFILLRVVMCMWMTTMAIWQLTRGHLAWAAFDALLATFWFVRVIMTSRD